MSAAILGIHPENKANAHWMGERFESDWRICFKANHTLKGWETMIKKDMTTKSELPRIISDANESGDAKHGKAINPAAVELHACIYAAVAIAKVHGITRRGIEQRALIGKQVLGDYLCNKPDCVMRIDQFAQLLFNPKVLGEDGHSLLLDEIALRCGRKVLMQHADEEHDGLVLESLDVTDAAGALAARVRDAVDPDSPGGARITQKEMNGIGASGRMVIDEALAMIPHVPGFEEMVV